VIDEIGAVARHSHALERNHQAALIRFGEKAVTSPFAHDPRDDFEVLLVVLLLKLRHGHENVVINALGQLI
jgi:hypothetical protein